MVPFYRPIKGMTQRASITVINYDCGKNHHNTLKICQGNVIKNNDISKNLAIILVESTVDIQCEDSRPWNHGTLIA